MPLESMEENAGRMFRALGMALGKEVMDVRKREATGKDYCLVPAREKADVALKALALGGQSRLISDAEKLRMIAEGVADAVLEHEAEKAG